MWYYAFSVDPINVIEDDSVCCVLWFGRVVRCCRYVPAMLFLGLVRFTTGCCWRMCCYFGIIRDGNGYLINFFRYQSVHEYTY